jgi:hypothetical protein
MEEAEVIFVLDEDLLAAEEFRTSIKRFVARGLHAD